MTRRSLGAAILLGLLSLLLLTPGLAQEKLRLVGSGASFPVPLYSAWFKDLVVF